MSVDIRRFVPGGDNGVINPQDFIELLSDGNDEIVHFKDDLSANFVELGSALYTLSGEINSFVDMIEPYVSYFYPLSANTADENFINDVIIPNRDKLDESLEGVVRGVQGDVQVTDGMEGAIEESLTLQKSVDVILEVIESIELYAVNTMIVSVQAGSEGKTLTKISEEMAQLSGMVSDITVHFRTLIERLHEASRRFHDRRHKIEVIYENYLTRMKIRNKSVFNDMVNELEELARYVNDLMSSSVDVRHSLGDIISSMQMEDIVRQHLEKMIYFTDAIIRSQRFWSESGIAVGNGRVLSAVLLISRRMIASIEQSFSQLVDRSNGCMEQFRFIIKGIVEKFYRHRESTEEKRGLRGIYDRLDEMRNQYIGYVEEIIKHKKDLYEVSLEILQLVNQFGGFFDRVSDVARRFEIINVLTRIELARHMRLKRSLGAALSDVRHLPKRIKRIVEQSQSFYNGLRANMTDAVRRYDEGFRKQETVLNWSIQSIKGISQKLDESQKYFVDIRSRVRESTSSILGLLEAEEDKLSYFISAEGMFRELNDRIDRFVAAEELPVHELESYSDEIQLIREFIEHTIEDSYRRQMLVSLLNESQETEKEECVILF